MRRLRSLVALAATLLLPAVARGVLAEQPASSEQFLPKRTIAFAKVPNAAEFRRKWDQSSFGAIQRDSAFAPFFADLERQLDERTARVKRATGASLKDLWLSLQGEVALAVVDSPGQGGERSHSGGFAVVGIAEIGKDEPSAARAAALLEAALKAHGAVSVQLRAGDVDVTSWSIGNDADKTTFSCFRRGRHLVAGFDLNTVLALAARSKSTGNETLAQNPVYQYIMDQTRASSGDPAVQWFVDPIGGLEAALDLNLEGNPNRDLIAGLLKKAGVEKIKGIGGSLELASAFADNITRTFGYVEPPVEGLLEAFRLPATHQIPPQWVKEDFNFYVQLNWSGPRFYRVISEFFDSWQGAGAFRSLVGSGRLANSQWTFEDCLNQMVGPLHIAANFPRSAGELFKQPAVVAIGIADPKKATAMLHAVAESAGAKVRSVDGRETYTFGFGAPGSTGALEVAASVAEGSLMLSLNSRYLESVIAPRAKTRSLAQSPAYRAATGEFPEKTSMLSYQRQNWRFEGLYEAIRGGKFQLPLYGGIVTGLGLDFSKLPPARAIRNHLATSSSFIEPADKGFRLIEIGYRPANSENRRPGSDP
jgi:hypothetical protein